jgi:hypothetical protein
MSVAGGPSDACVVLTTADYATPAALAAAAMALYDGGYQFAFTATKGSDTWIGFVGIWEKRSTP